MNPPQYIGCHVCESVTWISFPTRLTVTHNNLICLAERSKWHFCIFLSMAQSGTSDAQLSKGLFTLYVTSQFRSVTSRLRSVTSPFRHVSVPSRHVSVPSRHVSFPFRHVSVPFRRRCWARMFDVKERVRTGLYLIDSDNVISLPSPALHCSPYLSSEIDKKNIGIGA